MKTRLILLMLLVCQLTNAKIHVEGIVLDGSERCPLRGAQVIDTKTNTGVVTDILGRFSIDCEDGTDVLQISFVGMVTQERRLFKRMCVTLYPRKSSKYPQQSAYNDIVKTTKVGNGLLERINSESGILFRYIPSDKAIPEEVSLKKESDAQKREVQKMVNEAVKERSGEIRNSLIGKIAPSTVKNIGFLPWTEGDKFPVFALHFYVNSCGEIEQQWLSVKPEAAAVLSNLEIKEMLQSVDSIRFWENPEWDLGKSEMGICYSVAVNSKDISAVIE